MNLKAVITGDIINSSGFKTSVWLKKLKETLSENANELKWEIFRGDSFQLIVEPQNAVESLFLIKSGIKTIKGLDVRMALGIGEIDHRSKKITESNGSAFVNSGRSLESLKKETLSVQSNDEGFNEAFGVMIGLADFIAKGWQPATSEVIYTALKNPEMSQKELAKALNKKSQGNISEALKRGGYEEITKIINWYKKQIQE